MKSSLMPKGNLHNLADTTGWDFTLWWWNTEQNPRPSSEQESVRKSPVPILDHLAVFADIRQSRGTTGWLGSMWGTGSQSSSGLGDIW